MVASLCLLVVLFLDAMQELGRLLIAGLLVFQSLGRTAEGGRAGWRRLEGMRDLRGSSDIARDMYGCLGIRSLDQKSEKVCLVPSGSPTISWS